MKRFPIYPGMSSPRGRQLGGFRQQTPEGIFPKAAAASLGKCTEAFPEDWPRQNRGKGQAGGPMASVWVPWVWDALVEGTGATQEDRLSGI